MSANYLSHGYMGDNTIMVLINPMHVTACPVESGYNKGRCCEYLPICAVDRDNEGKIIQVDETIIEADTSYTESCTEKLFELVSNNTAYELNINNILSPLSQDSLENILDRLEGMEDTINNRIITYEVKQEDCNELES